MGMEFLAPPTEENQTIPHQDLPSILLVGPPNVGKRSIVKRLLAMGNSKGLQPSNSEISWTIDTKYYTADVHIWTACLSDSEAYANAKARSLSDHCEALVLVFDLSHFSSFGLLQEWISELELQKFDILLCVGNKADRVPGHFGHREYRKRLQKRGESSSDPHPEFWDYGIQQSDGSSLLGSNEELLDERRRSCMEWCMEHGIEYIEACAIDDIFDKCMSIDGDSQGLSRIWGALSAHMWPGMVMKSEKKLSDTMPLPEVEDGGSDSDSEINIEYELLSNGSAEPWDGDEGPWTFYENLSGECTEADGIQEASIIGNVSWEQSQSRASSQQNNGSSMPATPHGVTTVPADSSLSADDTTSHSVGNSLLSPVVIGNGPSGNNASVIEAISGQENSVVNVERQGGTNHENGARQQEVDPYNDLEHSMLSPDVIGNGQSGNNASAIEAISGQENSVANAQRQEGTNHENGARQQEVDSYNDSEHSMLSPDVIGNGQSGNNTSSIEAISGQENSVANMQMQESTHHENGARQQQVNSYNDLEQLMHEMARMRENSRLMPDSQRREMAARLAMRMASMFDEED